VPVYSNLSEGRGVFTSRTTAERLGLPLTRRFRRLAAHRHLYPAAQLPVAAKFRQKNDTELYSLSLYIKVKIPYFWEVSNLTKNMLWI
jgi:hypothetical protein